MKMDSKTKAARNPAKLKTNNLKHRGNDIGKKPSQSVTPRTEASKGQLLINIEEGTRQTQEESIGSRQRLLATYEHAPIGIIENSPEGNYVNCNEEFCRITGYQKEELLTLTIKDLTYEEDYIFDIKLHQRLVAGDIPFYKLEKRYVRKDGKIIWAEVTRSLVRDADGGPLYTVGAVLDVSERKRVELEIRNLSRLPAENPNPVMRLTPDGNVLYANHASATLLEFWNQQIDQTITDELKNYVAEVFASGLKKEIEIEQNGKTFSCTLAPIREAGYVNFYGNDITERKRAEEALQQLNLQLESRVQSRTEKLNNAIQALRDEISERQRAEAQLVYQARLIANVNDAIIATDENLTIGYWNQAAEQIYGWKAEEVMGRSATEVLQSEFMDGNTRSEALQKVKETGELRTAVTHLRKDGTRIFIDAHTSTLRNEEGKTVGYISINHDVTERTLAEEALHKSRESLRKLSKRLVEVQEDERRAIARELHDRVGQTLAALNINLMIMNGQLLEDSKQRIGSRLNDSMHLVAEAIALVRNVMTDLRPAVLDDYGLEAALQSYIDEYESRYDIKVLLDPSDQSIPRLDPSVEMTLLRIAQEALTNVARHAQAGQVNVSLQLADHSVHLTVQDNGVGIESWQRANQPGSHGMRIMRERAEAFGGSLNVGSTPGNGTKVEARIPVGSGGQHKVQEEKE
jgi:PAS domain S-box-containing protein